MQAIAPPLGINPTCLQGYTLEQMLGSGTAGRVWQVCQDETCPYALKVVIVRPDDTDQGPQMLMATGLLLPTTMSESNFQREVALTAVAGLVGAGPQLYGAWICDDPVILPPGTTLLGRQGYVEVPTLHAGFILTEKLDIPISDWVRQNPELWKIWQPTITAWLTDKVDRLTQQGIIHHDFHYNNILLRLDEDSQPVDVFIIDYDPQVTPWYPPNDIPEYEYTNIQTSIPHLLHSLNS